MSAKEWLVRRVPNGQAGCTMPPVQSRRRLSITNAQAQGGTPSKSASDSQVSEAFFYSFSIVETKSGGTSIQDSTSNSAYLSGDSTAPH